MFLVQLSRAGPAWDPARPVEEQLGWEAHATYLDALVDDGVVVLGGPLADERRVILAVEAPSEHAVRAILAADPWSGTHLVLDAVDPGRSASTAAGTVATPPPRRTRPGPVGSPSWAPTPTPRTRCSASSRMCSSCARCRSRASTPPSSTSAAGAALAVVGADPGEPLERTVGLLVDDLEAMIGLLHAAGVETDGIHENDRWRYTHFRPPDGRLYELVEERVRA